MRERPTARAPKRSSLLKRTKSIPATAAAAAAAAAEVQQLQAQLIAGKQQQRPLGKYRHAAATAAATAAAAVDAVARNPLNDAVEAQKRSRPAAATAASGAPG